MKIIHLIQNDTLSLLDGVKSELTKESTRGGFFSYKLIETSKFTLTVWDLFALSFVIIATFFIIKGIKRAFLRNERIDLGKRYSLFNLTRYIIILIAFFWSLDILGMQLTLLLGGSAALLVGIGMGLQNLFSDFVSGVILLVDSSIKVGDVIDVDGLVCQVSKINLRTTQVLTRDDKYILLPNTLLTKNRIINWTHIRSSSRFDVSVGVDYSSDIDLVMKLLKDACEEQPGVEKTPAPFVRFNDFGDSSLDFTVYFWSTNIFRVENVKSEIRKTIFRKFQENNVDIPFPQRTLHFHENRNKILVSQDNTYQKHHINEDTNQNR